MSIPPPTSRLSKAAYFLALRWLTARELSEAQVRLRLAEQGYTDTAIAPPSTGCSRSAPSTIAVPPARWHVPKRASGATVRSRVFAKLMAMQIDRELAKDVVRELFGEEDAETCWKRRSSNACAARRNA